MHHDIDLSKLLRQAAKFEYSRIGVRDHDLIHTKVLRVRLGKLYDRQHGHPGIESASLTKEERRNDRVAQFGIPTGTRMCRLSFVLLGFGSLSARRRNAARATTRRKSRRNDMLLRCSVSMRAGTRKPGFLWLQATPPQQRQLWVEYHG